MLEFALSGLRSGLRGRSFHAVFFLGVLTIGIAYLSGFFSPRQPQTVALDVGFSGIRFSLVLLNLFWVQELVAREIDRRVILFSLAYPVSRAAFLAGRFAAVLLLSLLAATVHEETAVKNFETQERNKKLADVNNDLYIQHSAALKNKQVAAVEEIDDDDALDTFVDEVMKR